LDITLTPRDRDTQLNTTESEITTLKLSKDKKNENIVDEVDRNDTNGSKEDNIKIDKKADNNISLMDENSLIGVDLKSRLKEIGGKFGDEVFIRIFKSENILEVWLRSKGAKEFKPLKFYEICNYSGELGPKLKEGDGQAPEGFYKVYKGSLNPNSSYHLSFNLGFPNRYDRSHKRTGSYLMVHGDCVSIGCYAMGDKNIEEIYKLVKEGLFNSQKYVQVHIFPFKMEKLEKYRGNRWYSFWSNLKEGYQIFEEQKIPPLIKVKNKRYHFIKRGEILK